MYLKPSYEAEPFNSNDVTMSKTIFLCPLFLYRNDPRLNHTKQCQLIFLDVSSIGAFPQVTNQVPLKQALPEAMIRLGLQCVFSPGTRHWLLALTCSHQALPNHMCSSPRSFLSVQGMLAGCSLKEMNQKPQRQVINSLFLA